MDFRQLRYFVSIVELGSITAASQALHVAQPSLSQHVANLEAELGVPLLVRNRNGAYATEAGELLFRQAKVVLRQIEETTELVKQQFDRPTGRVVVGLPTSVSRLLAVPLLREITSRYPGIAIALEEGGTAELAGAVLAQKLDLAVCVEVPPQSGMHVTPVLNEEIVLVAGPSHKNREPISPEALAELPLILPSFRNSIRTLYEQLRLKTGLPLVLLAETSVMSIALDAVAAGLGYTLQPWSSAFDWNRRCSTELVMRQIVGRPLVRQVSLCISLSAQQNRACQLVRKVMLDLMVDLADAGTGGWPGTSLITDTSKDDTAGT